MTSSRCDVLINSFRIFKNELLFGKEIFIISFKKDHCMPTYLDGHKLTGVNKEALNKLQGSPRDEFGVVHYNIYYNLIEERCYCLTDAPNEEAVKKHHESFGLDCEFITSVDGTAPFKTG